MLLLSGTADAPPLKLVLIPSGGTHEECVAREALAAALRPAPSLRILRKPLTSGDPLNEARTRHGAAWALDGRRDQEAFRIEITDGDGPTRKSTSRSLQKTLSKVWPAVGPKLPLGSMDVLPNPQALQAACENDAVTAYDAAGAAVGRVLPRLVPPPTKHRQGTLLQRWAFASHAARHGDCRRALPILGATLFALESGELPPLWRRSAPPSRTPSNLALMRETIVVFEDGDFIGLDRGSGRPKWTHSVGAAEPTLASIEDGLWLAIHQNGLWALQENGRVMWKAELKSPASEIAFTRDALFVSTPDTVVALDRGSGEIRWTWDGLEPLVAGPVIAKRKLAIPMASQVVLLDPDRGIPLQRVELGDEISAPLTVTPEERLWALVGSDELVLIDPARAEIAKRLSDISGVTWPPALLWHGAAVIAHQPRKPPYLVYLTEDGSSEPTTMSKSVEAPALALPDFSGVLYRSTRPPAVVARDREGALQWQARQPQTVSHLSAERDIVTAAVGRRTVFLDRKKGTKLAEVLLEKEVQTGAYDADGGAALLYDGTIYGLPSGRDPRLATWLQDVRMEMAGCHLELGQTRSAERVARKALERNADQIDALAMIAEISADASAWLKIHQRAPENDPLHTRASQRLDKLAGIIVRTTRTPARKLAAAPTGGFALLTKTEVVGYSSFDATVPSWRATAHDLQTAGEGLVRTGDRLRRWADGQPITPKLKNPPHLMNGHVFELARGHEPSLARLGADGKRLWRIALDRDDFEIADAARRHVVLTSPSGTIRTLELDTGVERWTRSLELPIRGAHLSGNRLLVALDKSFMGVDARNGTRRFGLSMDPETVSHIIPFSTGWILMQGTRWRWFDGSKARLTTSVKLSETPHQWAIASEASRRVAIVRLTRALIAVDLERARVLGRIQDIDINTIEAGTRKVFALEKGGRVLAIDPNRGLGR